MTDQKDYDAVVTVEIRATIDKVWDGITNPAIIKQYMHGTNVKTDWQVGSPIVWEGVWKDAPYQDKGVITEYSPNTLLAYTHWSPMSGIEDKPENYHAVSMSLSEQDGTTKLTLTQSNNSSQEAADMMAKNAWSPMIHTLKSLLEQW